MPPRPDNKIRRPFVRYYGAKFRLRNRYPRSSRKRIIEPFCGLAGYSTAQPNREVILYDVNENIVQLWEYLINVSERDFLALPINWKHISEIKGVPPEGILYLRWVCNVGTPILHNVLTDFAKSLWNEKGRAQLASQLQYIRHWTVEQKDYKEIDIDQRCTWFVDPPYNNDAGKKYPHCDIDYDYLGRWCKKLKEQVIVCENYGATWLPFRKLCVQSGAARGRKMTMEGIWCKKSPTKKVGRRNVKKKARR